MRFRDATGRVLEGALPEIAHDLTRIRSRRALLDGILVANDDHGRPSSELLGERLAAGETAALIYYAFDVLGRSVSNARSHLDARYRKVVGVAGGK